MKNCNNITQHVPQYYCKKCTTLLKETETPIDYAKGISEECPTCGHQISEILQVRKFDLKQGIVPKLQTAYELNAKLTFDVAEIDGLMSLSIGDRACICGSPRQANLLVTRLLVRALMSQRYGGLGSKNIVCIDGGNCANVYQCVNFARQYGMDIRHVLQRIIISRAFTVYQLAALIVRILPEVVRRFNTKIVIIPDMLKMFVDDPQVRPREANYLIREMMKAIGLLPGDILVLVSLYTLSNKYDKSILSNFGKRIEIMENKVRLFKNQNKLFEFSLPDVGLRIVPR